ncbi:MAG: RNA polymerase sigma factor [Flavobacteriaceae bacterium]|nr:RNA polymerase sigma factor [Flavobacteriaceae bacterium]
MESLPISADDENRGDSKEQRIARLQRAMQNLPFDQRMVLKLFYLESYSIKEISRITKVSTSTVKTRLFRAREKLKEVLKNE